MDETSDLRVINGGNGVALGLGTGLAASQVSPRAERGAARRERERERRLRELFNKQLQSATF